MRVINHRREPDAEGIWILRHTPHGNPFTVREYGRDEALRLFKTYAEERARKEPEWLKVLVGSDLICCCKPAPCHGDILAQMVLDKYGGPRQ